MSTERRLIGGALVAMMCWGATPAIAQNADQKSGKNDKARADAATETYDTLDERYLSSARAMSLSPTANINWMAGLSADCRARGMNDSRHHPCRREPAGERHRGCGAQQEQRQQRWFTACAWCGIETARGGGPGQLDQRDQRHQVQGRWRHHAHRAVDGDDDGAGDGSAAERRSRARRRA